MKARRLINSRCVRPRHARISSIASRTEAPERPIVRRSLRSCDKMAQKGASLAAPMLQQDCRLRHIRTGAEANSIQAAMRGGANLLCTTSNHFPYAPQVFLRVCLHHFRASASRFFCVCTSRAFTFRLLYTFLPASYARAGASVERTSPFSYAPIPYITPRSMAPSTQSAYPRKQASVLSVDSSSLSAAVTI